MAGDPRVRQLLVEALASGLTRRSVSHLPRTVGRGLPALAAAAHRRAVPDSPSGLKPASAVFHCETIGEFGEVDLLVFRARCKNWWANRQPNSGRKRRPPR
jgi:hypothetical protein